MSELLESVAELAALTGGIAASMFGGPLVVERKSDGSLVSRADRDAELAARAWIEHRYPDDAILGEEFGSSGDGAGRTWLLDPIDGTISYLAGVPLYATLIALKDGDDVIAAAVSCPSLGRTLVAARGEGCWENGRPVRVSTVNRLAEALIVTSDPWFTPTPECRPAWERLAARSRVIRSWGDGYGYLLVATGSAEVMADAIVHPWDIAAPSLVVAEAGGSFTAWPGRDPCRSGLATNAALAPEVRDVLS